MIFIPPLHNLVVYINPNLLFRKLGLVTFGANCSIKLQYFFLRSSNWRFVPFSRKLVSISICMPKIGSSLCVDRKILNMKLLFHKQYRIYIPKGFLTSNSFYFKANEANGIFHLFCSRIFLLIVLLLLHWQPVDY